MFDIKRIISILLALAMASGATACKKKTDGDGTVANGEIVVMEDLSEINLGVYEIDTWNPLETKSKSVQRISNIVYEPLFSYDENRNIEAVLAKDYVLSEDGKKITVNLKDNIKWQDGTVFSADDVIYTLSKLCASNGLYKTVADKIHGFTATSKNQVVINLETPQTDFSYCLTFPILSKNSKYVTDDSFVMMGTGAYKTDKRSSTEMLLIPNDAWHGGAVSKKNISVRILKDGSAVSDAFNVNGIDALTSDELDLTSQSPKRNSQIRTYVSDNMLFLGFNVENNVLMPSNIRRAVCKILDKQKIVDSDAYGYGKVADIPVNPSSWAYVKSEEKSTPETYEELIIGSGYTMNEGVYYKDGTPLKVGILVNANNSVRIKTAESICDMLTSAGFSAYVDITEYSDYITRINDGNYDMFVGEVTVGANLNPMVMLANENNYFRYNDENLSKAASALYGVKDHSAYKAGIENFMKIFNGNPPYVPIYFKTESVIYGSYVSGVVSPTSFDTYKSIEKWYFYDKDGKEKRSDGEKTDE